MIDGMREDFTLNREEEWEKQDIIQRAMLRLRRRKNSFIHQCPEKQYRECLEEIVPRVIKRRKDDSTWIDNTRLWTTNQIRGTLESEMGIFSSYDPKTAKYPLKIIRECIDVVLAITEPKPQIESRGRKPREYPIQQLRELREQGLTIREISEKIGISKSTIHRLLSPSRTE